MSTKRAGKTRKAFIEGIMVITIMIIVIVAVLLVVVLI